MAPRIVDMAHQKEKVVHKSEEMGEFDLSVSRILSSQAKLSSVDVLWLLRTVVFGSLDSLKTR